MKASYSLFTILCLTIILPIETTPTEDLLSYGIFCAGMSLGSIAITTPLILYSHFKKPNVTIDKKVENFITPIIEKHVIKKVSIHYANNNSYSANSHTATLYVPHTLITDIESNNAEILQRHTACIEHELGHFKENRLPRSIMVTALLASICTGPYAYCSDNKAGICVATIAATAGIPYLLWLEKKDEYHADDNISPENIVSMINILQDHNTELDWYAHRKAIALLNNDRFLYPALKTVIRSIKNITHPSPENRIKRLKQRLEQSSEIIEEID